MADTEKKSSGKEVAKDGKKAKAEKPKPGKPRNYKLPTGVYRFSHTRMIKKRALYRYMGKNRKPTEPVKRKSKPTPQRYKKKPIGGEKNGQFRLIRIKKLPKYYPTEKRPKKIHTKAFFCKHKRNLRKTITPGTVLILVAGRHRGKRVVFLKQLKSGLLLVTGPFKLNACPLRRINQIYVIATKTKLDISKVELPKLSDGYFKRRHPKRKKKDEGEIFETKKEVYKVTERRKQDQINVDKQILEVIRQHPDSKMLYRYLAAQFSLRNKMYPHKMKF